MSEVQQLTVKEAIEQEVFVLKGLNRGWKAAGFPNVYGTIEYGKEDWFHCAFDEELFPADRLDALFRLFKDTEDNLWSGKIHKVLIAFERLSSSGCPVNPIIKELHLDKNL